MTFWPRPQALELRSINVFQHAYGLKAGGFGTSVAPFSVYIDFCWISEVPDLEKASKSVVHLLGFMHPKNNCTKRCTFG